MAPGSETSRNFHILKEQIRQKVGSCEEKKFGFMYFLKKKKKSNFKRI